MVIQKFGGTSVGSAARMKQVAELVSRDGAEKIVVLSAMSGTTNRLVEIADHYSFKQNEAALNKLSSMRTTYLEVTESLYNSEHYRSKANELIEVHFDYMKSFAYDLFTVNEVKSVLAQGELLSTALFQFYLEESGIESCLIPALNFIRIDREGEPDSYYIKQNLHRELAMHPGTRLFVTQGFICRDAFGEIDNLKRGGSDYTASLIGAAIGADHIEIWTDIDGFHDNDPRVVENTHTIPELSFDEAAELAYFGAKILHPSTIQPAKVAQIPVFVKNTMNSDARGTRISEFSSGGTIKAVAAKEGITAIRIKSSRMLLAYGFLAKIFELFEIYKTPIDMITTSEISVSLTIDDNSNLNKLVEELNFYGTTEVDHDLVIICVVGEGIAGNAETVIHVMNALKGLPVRMVSYGGSQNNISILIHSEHKKSALNNLSNALFNSRKT
jgi:aspartate kinase